mgnify:CR=1 FL=1
MESIFQHITQALGWSILHSLWQGVLVYGLLSIVMIGIPTASARYKHAIALISQYVIFVAFLITFGYYLNTTTPTMTTVSIAHSIEQTRQSSVVNIVTYYLQSVFPWFSTLYIVGLLIQIIICSQAYTKSTFIRKRGVSAVPQMWSDLFSDLKETLKVKSTIAFQLSNKVTVPVTLGYLKPIILFPVALANNLDIKQVETILLHELAHIKRNDYLLNLIKIAIETLLFFNPFIWLLSRQIEHERENACDDFVVGYIGSPIAYAQALMSVEIHRQEIPPHYAMAATNNKHYLLERIKRITKMEHKYNRLKKDFVAVGISALTLIGIACTAPNKIAHNINNKESSNKIATKTITTTKENKVTSITPGIPAAAPTQPPVEAKKVPKKVKKLEADLQKNVVEIQDVMNSPEWKQKINVIQEEAQNTAKLVNSPQIQQSIKAITEEGLRLSNLFQSDEYLSLLSDAEKNAEKIAAYSESPEFKAKIANIEQQAKKIEDYYKSPEWKDEIRKIEKDAQQIEEYFDSQEWKTKIDKIEKSAKKIEDYYNSPEWSEKVKKIDEKK